MKRISIIVLTALIAIVFAQQESSIAQKRRPTRPVKPTPTPVPDMRPEASQVATQIKNVSNFLYVYGKIVNSLEVADEQVKNKQTSPEIQEKNQKSKDALVVNINKLRAGLEKRDGRVVIDGLGEHRTNDAQVVDHPCRVRQEIADPGTGLAMLLKWK